jgi:hypothetical protein
MEYRHVKDCHRLLRDVKACGYAALTFIKKCNINLSIFQLSQCKFIETASLGGGVRLSHQIFQVTVAYVIFFTCAYNFRWYRTIVLSDGHRLPLSCRIFYCVTVDRSVWNYAPNDAVSHPRRPDSSPLWEFKTSEKTFVGKVLRVNKCPNYAPLVVFMCSIALVFLYVQYCTGLPLLTRCWILNFVISRNPGRFTVRTSLILTLIRCSAQSSQADIEMAPPRPRPPPFKSFPIQQWVVITPALGLCGVDYEQYPIINQPTTRVAIYWFK